MSDREIITPPRSGRTLTEEERAIAEKEIAAVLEEGAHAENRLLGFEPPRISTIEDVQRQQDQALATAFASEQIERIHAKYAHLLPTEFPSGQKKPHVCGPGIGDGCCRCEFEPFKRGGLYASWCGQIIEDSRKSVVRILGEIDNDNGGGTWIVGRVLASDAPAYCGQMVHFAANSIMGHSMDECEELS